MHSTEIRVKADEINSEIQNVLGHKIAELIDADDPSIYTKIQQEIKALISRGADLNKITFPQWHKEPSSHLERSLTFLLSSGWNPNYCLTYILNHRVILHSANSDYGIQNLKILKKLVNLACARGANLEEIPLKELNINSLPFEVLQILLEYGLAPQALILYFLHGLNRPDTLKIMHLAIQKGVLIPTVTLLLFIPNNYVGIEILRLMRKHANLSVDQEFSLDFLLYEIYEIGKLLPSFKEFLDENLELDELALEPILAYKGTLCHWFAQQGKTELLKYTMNIQLCRVNTLNAKGQTALFFASNAKIVELLLSGGADTSIRDLDGNTWLSAPPLEVAQYAIKTGRLDHEEGEAMARTYLTKGNFENVQKLFQAGIRPSIDPLECVIQSIETGIALSVEPNKYHALFSLIYRAGITIPHKSHYLIHNVSDTLKNEEFGFTHGLIHRLAKYYIAIAKSKFTEALSWECTLSTGVNILIDQAFVASAHNRYENFKDLTKVCPDSQTLKRVESEFDAIFMVVGVALIELDNDFTLDVLTVNGLRPPPLLQEVSVYRGLRANMDENDIRSCFKYGIRAFSMGQIQKFFGYYVKQPWNAAQGKWALGGTYVTLSTLTAAFFAAGGSTQLEAESILLHIILPKGGPRICGPSSVEYELAPSSVLGNEVFAVYKLEKLELGDTNQYLVTEAHYNPFLTNATQKYAPGDYVLFDSKESEIYNNLCDTKLSLDENAETFTLYANYDDFMLRYPPEYLEARVELDKHYFSDRRLVESEDLAKCDPSIACC